MKPDVISEMKRIYLEFLRNLSPLIFLGTIDGVLIYKLYKSDFGIWKEFEFYLIIVGVTIALILAAWCSITIFAEQMEAQVEKNKLPNSKKIVLVMFASLLMCGIFVAYFVGVINTFIKMVE